MPTPDTPPALARHMQALSTRRSSPTLTITPTDRGYRVQVDFTGKDRHVEYTLVRRKRRWIPVDLRCAENGREVTEADFAEVMRALSASGDRVGAPAEHTRHPGANPTLTTRAHTIIRN